MSTDAEGQLKQFYAAVMKNILKECLSPSIDLTESLTSELETRWMQRYESISSTSLMIDGRTENRESNTIDNPVGFVLFHFIFHT